jgi:hypothetical protein
MCCGGGLLVRRKEEEGKSKKIRNSRRWIRKKGREGRVEIKEDEK